MQRDGQEQRGQAGEEPERGEGHERAERCGDERAALVVWHRDALRAVARARFWTLAGLGRQGDADRAEQERCEEHQERHREWVRDPLCEDPREQRA
jgi:hypothetical protein